MTQQPLVKISDLHVLFKGQKNVCAVNGLSLNLLPGQVLGILGESGSGKSVTLKALLRLLPAHKTEIRGLVEVLGRNVMSLNAADLASFRGGIASMIFQDPMLALDPVYTIGDQIAEVVTRHHGLKRRDAMAYALDMLKKVRIPSPERRLKAYPHEISGGMRQRAMIALALAGNPKLLLADEPTTALDASVQMQILLLLRELQKESGMGMIFVTHDIGVAVEICDVVAVMYAGQIVETGTIRDIVKDPKHPYTKGLLAANLHGAERGKRLETIPGSPPLLESAPTSCSFAPRCAYTQAVCRLKVPDAVTISRNITVRCILETNMNS
jgi:peptide/nickel transport system ATP-binding protein